MQTRDSMSQGMLIRPSIRVCAMVAVEASPQLNISINRTWPAEKLGLPPAERRWGKYNGSFLAEEHTPISLLDQITQGYSFTAVLGGCQGTCCGA